MEYYAEQSLFIKIIIFVIAWLIIAILGKISVPQIPIPKWLGTVQSFAHLIVPYPYCTLSPGTVRRRAYTHKTLDGT